MTIKIFKKKEKNPKSQELVDETKNILMTHGITDKRKLNDCVLGMVKASIAIMKVIAKGENADDIIGEQTARIKEILITAGIDNPYIQDDIIFEYFCVIGELAGGKNE